MVENGESSSMEIIRGNELNLLDYLVVLARHWRMIAKVCGVTFVLTCGLSLLLPNIYTATCRILPPQEDGGGLSGMLGSMGGLASLAGISVGGSSGDLYVGMLKSRTIADAIIDRFGLMEVYDQEHRTKTHAALMKNVRVSLGKKDGIITVEVEDERAGRAAEMANGFVEELKKLNVMFNLNNAGRQRDFLEKRLSIVKADLAKAEDDLQLFQTENKAIKIDAQASAIIEAIAQLKGELASKEVELGVLLSSQTEQNPQVRALREGIVQINEQIGKLASSEAGKQVTGDIFIGTSAVPGLGVQYARKLREFKVQETLYELLTQQYEIAKIEEAKKTSTIQVLDEAVAPDKKSKPKRSLIVIMTTFVSGLIALFWAFIREYRQRMSDDDRLLWIEISKNLKNSRSKN